MLTEMSLIKRCGVLADENPYQVCGGIQPKFICMMSAQDTATVRLHFLCFHYKIMFYKEI